MVKMTKVLMRAALLVPAAGLLMGNQSCQQPQGRQLRKVIDMGGIVSPPLQLAPGSNFDFGFVMAQQMYGVIAESTNFILRYDPVVVTSADGAFMKLSNGDAAIMAKISGKSTGSPLVWSKEASCMAYKPQFRVKGSVNSFEMVGGGGLSIGFNPTGAIGGGILTGANASFNVEYAQLGMSMRAIHPILNDEMAAVNIDATQTKTRMNFSINLGMFSVGPSAYYNTPLANVTKNGLVKAFTALADQLDSKEGNEWYTRVVDGQDTDIVIRGGSAMNLRTGDQLAIYNEQYSWSGEPCESAYMGGGLSRAPVAVIEIDAVGDVISSGRVIQQTDENVVIGAKVKVLKLAEDKPK